MGKIYTSWYWGKQIGEMISISVKPPSLEKIDVAVRPISWRENTSHLLFLAPSKGLHRFWESSQKDKAAEEEYTARFRAEVTANLPKIKEWLEAQKENSSTVTLNCYEKYPQFCHRHLVAKIIQKYAPELWGGEVEDYSPFPIPHSPLPDSEPVEPESDRASVITNLGKISQVELDELQQWLETIKPYMFDSVSSYAPGRKELHLRHFVKLRKKEDPVSVDEVKPIQNAIAQKYQSQKIEEIGERLLPGFHQGLVLYYPKGSEIRKHADSPAYAKGAASIGIKGSATFTMYSWGDKGFSESANVGEGDCISFDNKQPHAVAPVPEDRWCVCFFYLKKLQEKPVVESQLPLFSDAVKVESEGDRTSVITNLDRADSPPEIPPASCTWEEWLWLDHGVKLYDACLNPATKPKPWSVNIGKYALYGGELVKIVGGSKEGKWQLERSPVNDPTHTLPNHKQWVKTSALTQPEQGHETWTDMDFKKVKVAA